MLGCSRLDNSQPNVLSSLENIAFKLQYLQILTCLLTYTCTHVFDIPMGILTHINIGSGIPHIQININSTIVTTAMVSSNDAKQEDSAHDSLLRGVHSGWDSEVKYSTNETREDVPVDDREHSTGTSMSN